MLRARFRHYFYSFGLLLLSSLSMAEPPVPYSSNFDARYKGLKAQASISVVETGDKQFLADTTIRIRLLGANISTIRETSQFEWYEDTPRPRYYEYKHSGVGARFRSASFDWQENLAIATVNNETTELNLTGNTLDELSMYTFIKNELNKGNTDIYFNALDRNLVEEFHYRVLGEEILSLGAGDFETIKVERIREDSERLTQLWFAKNHNMLMVKLFQRDPDGDEFEITLRDARINGEPVTPDNL